MKPSPNTIFLAPVHEVIKRLDSSQFNLIYIDPPFFRELSDVDDKLPYKTFREYLEYIVFVIHQSKRLLKDTGAILFRMEPLSPFNSRLFLDRIFSKQNFRAEIIWEFINRQSPSRLPRSNFDSVFFYSQSDGYTYHEPVTKMLEQELQQKYRHEDGRGFFKYWSLIASINRPEREFSWKGITPPKGSSWKYSLERLNELDVNGEIEIIRNNPRRRVYLTEDAVNSSMGFVWKGFTPLRPNDNGVDFKIQEIVKMASNTDDFIFDPFMLPRSISSFRSIERKWTGIALIDDNILYKTPNTIDFEILQSDSIHEFEIVDSGVLPQPISRLIDTESRAYDTSPSLKYIGQRYALLIGINNYKDGIPNLDYCVNDVKELEKVLTEFGYVVKTIHDDQEDDNLLPFRANILTEMGNLARDINPEDTLFVHFSCHGTLIKDNATLITADTRRKGLEKTCLYLEEIIETMKSGQAMKRVLSLDVCHAGVDTGRSIINQEFVDNVYNKAEGFALLAASTARQQASEPSQLQHGLFTYYLIQGLKGGADFGEDGRITVADIKSFTLNAVREWNLRNYTKQDPTFHIEGIGEIVLISPLNS